MRVERCKFENVDHQILKNTFVFIYFNNVDKSIFFNDFFRKDKIFLITQRGSIGESDYHRRIYEIVQKNDAVFIKFSRPFPHIERDLIFPQFITYKENETFNFYPQYVHSSNSFHEYWSSINWPSINLPFDIPDEIERCYWILRI